MKGVVFTEFINMVEEKFGYDIVDELLMQDGLTDDGAYTAVGTYPHTEMVQLVMGLHQKTEVEVPLLLKTFGKHLFGVFSKSYGVFFEHAKNAFDFLNSIENYIHVEVQKLYPDAELPRFENTMIDNKTLQMDYYSDRSMADLAEGLIESTFEHYQEDAHIDKTIVEPNGKHVRFVLKINS